MSPIVQSVSTTPTAIAGVTPERLVDADEIVEREIERQHVNVVLELL
jgi:hypothetical protein